eukprot:TRINITY_DN16132_c0_g1_i1.p1 TRINITY_DN16132_c0_g1~~TRINITY_DN16132_c0_g1_i1.p1  ORF type:complete len:421 (+),score=59.41 TRINITY_DN16132_c0_g1_i1:44-1306(+)
MRGRSHWQNDRRIHNKRRRKIAFRRCVLLLIVVMVWVPMMLLGIFDWVFASDKPTPTTITPVPTALKQHSDEHPTIPKMTPPPLINDELVISNDDHLAENHLRGGVAIPTDRSHASSDDLPHFTLVLCSWTGDAEGFPRVKLLLSSIHKFIPAASLKEIIFVVPELDVRNFEAIGSRQRLPFRVIPDEAILSLTKATADSLLPNGEKKQNGGRGGNYRLQMALKLGIARQVKTKFYITLDNDVFVKRNTTHDDIIINGKAIVQGNDGNNRESWWKAAGNILQDPQRCGGNLAKDPFQLGVTPAILAREISLGLLDFLEETYHSTFDKALFRMLHSKPTSDWTEYSLYWAWACKSRLTHELHVLASDRKIYDTSGFGWDSFSRYNVDRVFSDNSTFFGVVQSINGAQPKAVMGVLYPHILK